jgi:hypothetical protein
LKKKKNLLCYTASPWTFAFRYKFSVQCYQLIMNFSLHGISRDMRKLTRTLIKKIMKFSYKITIINNTNHSFPLILLSISKVNLNNNNNNNNNRAYFKEHIDIVFI